METPLKCIDRQKKEIDGSQLRLMMGGVSDERWAVWREIAGVQKRVRTLTRYEALILWALKHWRVICKDLGQPFALPKNILEIEPMLNQWLLLETNRFECESLECLVSLNAVKGNNFPTLIKVILGESISETSLRRIGNIKGIPPFSRTKTYTKEQVQKYLNHIVQSRGLTA